MKGQIIVTYNHLSQIVDDVFASPARSEEKNTALVQAAINHDQQKKEKKPMPGIVDFKKVFG